MSIVFTIPVSPEQEDVITEFVFGDGRLGMVKEERIWMLNHARKTHPGCTIVGADLNIATLEWDLTIETK